jgi:hypothetical protein
MLMKSDSDPLSPLSGLVVPAVKLHRASAKGQFGISAYSVFSIHRKIRNRK